MLVLEKSPLVGIVPDEWLKPERRLLENSLLIVAIHHQPVRVGHCVIFPKKKHVPRLQGCDVEDMVRSSEDMLVHTIRISTLNVRGEVYV